ncbi:acyltransferase family protein [Leekyejoonella antrihumi]|uniref:Acyltransferase n=1 Tax=Leekyejoonella antrihumi TaxID=1660198 RepID=A0A563E5J3_9MICO|nr:acyltransferase [Leekyejoonella antrihumi]TWP37134.1 acyltransferase [Leekyejoonella antrihumi]
MARFRLIDGLRAVAAALVLLTHVAFWTGAANTDFSGGLLARADSGVAVFFAISAFLLLRPWIRAGSAHGGHPSVRTYALRRAVRILPAYWLTLAAVLVVAALAPGRTGGAGSPGKIVLHALLLQGYTTQDYQSFTQTWSLTTEVTFYVFVPVIGVLLGRLARRGAVRVYAVLLGAVGVGLAAQGLAAQWSGSAPHGGGSVLATSVLGHLAWFAAGAAVAVGSVGVVPRLGPTADRWWRTVGGSPATLVGLAALLYLVASSSLAGPRGLVTPTVTEAVVKEGLYTLIALTLLLAARWAPESPVSRAVAASPATRWLGDISYGVFLWHVLILQIIYLLTGWPLFSGGFAWVLCAVVSLSILVAWASATLLEQPLLDRVHRRPRVPEPAP